MASSSLSKVRGATYAVSFATIIAGIAAMLDLGTFDAQTGMFDPAPFNVYLLAAAIPPAVASAVAYVAWALGWKR